MTAGRCEAPQRKRPCRPCGIAHRSAFVLGDQGILGDQGLDQGLGELYAVAHRGEVLQAMPSMDWDDYLRTEAAMYRQLAEGAENSFGKQELLDLAAVCEEVANSIEDRLTGG